MADLQEIENLIAQMPDDLPFLLFPVRLETRFMDADGGKELWIRIFPDDIAVHTHEDELTPEEVKSGEAYWQEIWKAAQLPADAEETPEQIEKGAWRALALAIGDGRANWVAGVTEPANLATAATEDDLHFDVLPGKEESWSQAPRSNIMPDHFIALAFQNGVEIFRQLSSPIPNPLILGPDPQAEEEFQQVDGELVVGEDFHWVYNFDKAVEVGMGLKIKLDALSPPFNGQAIDRLLVLGVRTSTGADENKGIVEKLFENHKYSPDGMSLLPQGTPTNNTTGSGSGYSSIDPGAEQSFAERSAEAPFFPVEEASLKSDRQRLAEALGVDYGAFQRVGNINQHDVSEALSMNNALWYGTLGYFLDEMLEVDLQTLAQIRQLFITHITGRGPLPALRVGSQPYGLLLTSDFNAWKWSPNIEGPSFSLLERLVDLAHLLEVQWQKSLGSVVHVASGGDPKQNLLSMLGLHATSVEFHRRHAVGMAYLWNYALFLFPRAFVGNPPRFEGLEMLDRQRDMALGLLSDLGINSGDLPRLFDLFFFSGQDETIDPLVDDIAADEVEKLSEENGLREAYTVSSVGHPESIRNYIGWLAGSSFEDLRGQNFRDENGDKLPVPRPLLYRMLRGALLQSFHEAAIQWYRSHFDLPIEARREVELANMDDTSTASRTVTKWEFLDTKLSALIPNADPISVGEFLRLVDANAEPEVLHLDEVYESLERLEGLSTASLERLFSEHLDLCSYRLDAWQMGCFDRRLQQQRLGGIDGSTTDRRLGLYLGAFGWLENLKQSALVPVIDPDIPLSLHNPDVHGPLFEQADNGGFIHSPSLNHAVAAAVLRSAYLTHRDTADPLKMAVNLSSERVRLALMFLEGIRNGQELGALLGYQFERGLHERYGDRRLNQYIPMFRKRYPLVADKITPDEDGEPIETKEARNVFDGYALLEVAFLREGNPVTYPYGVAGLPDDETSDHARFIKAEVERMVDTFDAIADLALAEGVFQAAQGNFDRAGAMMRAISEGNSPVEPEIVSTPRSGAQFTQRVALHLETGDQLPPLPADEQTPRAVLEPGLNKWLGDLLPAQQDVAYTIQIGDQAPIPQNLDRLNLQPIDLVYLIGDDLSKEATELESRIAYENRALLSDDGATITINFMPGSAPAGKVSLFELLPLLRTLRRLVTSTTPLGPDHFRLSSELDVDPDEETGAGGYNLENLSERVDDALSAFDSTLGDLEAAVSLDENDEPPELALIEAESVREALRAMADFGLPDTIPTSLSGSSDEAKSALTIQATNTILLARGKRDDAKKPAASAADEDLPEGERVSLYREAAREIFGAAFNLIPIFNLKNSAEIQAAAAFRDADAPANLTRFHKDNPLLVEDWLEGVAPVRGRMGAMESAGILGSALGADEVILKPLQLPFRDTDHWIAMEYPEVPPGHEDDDGVFVPQGEFLSVVQWLPDAAYDPSLPQSGLLIDEWVEVIPGRGETTGIAVHYNQPSTEPPQALLLAVTPAVTGLWNVEELIGILNNTLDRAKLRAVEPDQLGDTALGHLIPAVISAVTSRQVATISTDFVHQTAINSL